LPFVVDLLQNAADILRRELNIRLVPHGPFKYHSASGRDIVTAAWVRNNTGPSDSDVLDAPCAPAGLGADLGASGSRFDFLASTNCFFGSFRRVVGYGGPIACFVVRTIPIGDGSCGSYGCGMWITNYITARHQPCPGEGAKINRRVIAHELGHTGNLWHLSAADNELNLMGVPWDRSDPPIPTQLETWQVLAWRASKHVTYL
jgi:hypothetical protein